MTSEESTLLPRRGEYVPSSAGDKRSPCPLVNCLANHGYIPRNGRDIAAHQLKAAANEVGLSTALGAVFAKPIFNLHQDPALLPAKYLWKEMGFLRRAWTLVCNPWSVLSMFGMRRWDPENGPQLNERGKAVLDLDQLALPGIIEHDISLTRHDYAQPDGNNKPQAELIKDLLACSKDGEISLEAFAALRKRRIQQQVDQNLEVYYGSLQHTIACTEIALVLGVFGNGKSLPIDYARAIFQEERLPIKEGWKRRRWWTLGFGELGGIVSKVKAAVGLDIK